MKIGEQRLELGNNQEDTGTSDLPTAYVPIKYDVTILDSAQYGDIIITLHDDPMEI